MSDESWRELINSEAEHTPLVGSHRLVPLEHPPILPNSGLTQSRGVWRFERGFNITEFTMNTAVTRPIVAAIAEVNWRRELGRLEEGEFPSEPSREEIAAHRKLIKQAEKNIDDWREWGEVKS